MKTDYYFSNHNLINKVIDICNGITAVIFALIFISYLASCNGVNADVSLNVKDTISLNSNEGAKWTSDNDFIAIVSEDGLVSAMHVGTTKIMATTNGNTTTYVVSVESKNHFFNEPIHDFLLTKDNIKKISTGELIDEETQSLKYRDGYNVITYKFNSKGILTASAIKLNLANTKEITPVLSYLADRYEPAGETKEGVMFINAYKNENATMGVLVMAKDDGLLVAYGPYDATKKY